MKQVESLVKKKVSDPVQQSEICFFQGIICYFQNDSAQSVTFFMKSMELLPRNTCVALRANGEYWACVALHLDGQKDIAIQRLHDGIRIRDLKEGMILSRLMFALCFIHSMDGEFLQVAQEAQKMRKICKLNNLVFAETWAVYLQGNASFQISDFNAAQKYFGWVMENRYNTNPRAALDAMAALAVTGQLLGKPHKDIDDIMSLAHEYALWSRDTANFEIVSSCGARIALLRGDIDAASKWQRSLGDASGTLMLLFFLEIPMITECRVFIACKSEASLTQAIEKLENIQKKTILWRTTFHRMEIITLQALARSYQGRLEEALSILEEAVALCAINDGTRMFLELGAPMENLLGQLLSTSIAVDTVNEILKAFRHHEHLTPSVMPKIPESSRELKPEKTLQPLIDPLTQREMEILDLLAQHLYNKEIAEKLLISPETVKTHLKNIYEKLAVGSRRQAVSKALALNLIVH